MGDEGEDVPVVGVERFQDRNDAPGREIGFERVADTEPDAETSSDECGRRRVAVHAKPCWCPSLPENVEFHLLDGGHFALESHGAFITTEILEFLDREVAQEQS